MLNSLYRSIISDAFRFSWRNRYIWIFGLFAAVLGNGGEYEIFFKAIGKSIQGTTFPTLGILYANNVFSLEAIRKLFSTLFSNPISFFLTISIIGLFFLLFIFIIWLASISQAGLVYSAHILSQAKETSFSQAYTKGREYLFPVLGVNIIYYLIITIIFSIVGLPAYLVFFAVGPSRIIWFYLLNFLVFLPLAIIMSFITKYALGYIVLKGKGLLDALYLGWKLFLKNWLVSLEMVAILFVIDIVFSLGTLFVMILAALPFIIFGLFMYYLNVLVGTVIMYIFALLTAFVILMIVGMFIVSFQYSAWTLLFIRLTQKRGLSKLVRLFSGL